MLSIQLMWASTTWKVTLLDTPAYEAVMVATPRLTAVVWPRPYAVSIVALSVAHSASRVTVNLLPHSNIR